MILIFLALVAVPTPQGCDSTDQTVMNKCAEQKFEIADAQLKRTWRELVRETHKFDAEIRRNGGSRVTYQTLLLAQRNWLKYRDSQCDAEGNQYLGGSMAPGIEYLCMERTTRARTKELNDMTAIYRQ